MSDDRDYGIDISSWNAVSNWPAVRGNNISFASIKTTQGDYYTNPSARGQTDGARGAGVAPGAYHFADPNVSVDRNVGHFIDTSKPLGLFEQGSFLPMLDVEDSPRDNIYWNAYNANTFIPQWIRQFRDRSGVAPVAIYASLSVWTGILREDEWADDQVYLWIALYNGDPGNTHGYHHRRAALHQHTNQGNVPGVNGYVDRNVTINGFRTQNLTIGNVAPPAPGPGPAPQPSPGGWVDYRIVPGDTLSGIAAARGTTVDELVRVNSIRDRNLIYVGQVIRVPAGSGGGSTEHYRIQPGDTLSAIAAKFGTTVEAIAAANGIPDPNKIYAGQWIDIPRGGGGGRAETPPHARVYTVQPAEYLGLIAGKLGVTVDHLVRMNNIQNPNLIFPGQQLRY